MAHVPRDEFLRRVARVGHGDVVEVDYRSSETSGSRTIRVDAFPEDGVAGEAVGEPEGLSGPPRYTAVLRMSAGSERPLLRHVDRGRGKHDQTHGKITGFRVVDGSVPDARGEGRVPDSRGEGSVPDDFDFGGGL